MSLEYYLNKFQSLNTMRQQGHNKPHKICMLLAIMDLIAIGTITDNKIELNNALRRCFTLHFDRLKAGNDKDTPENPFYHLISEGFWHLKPVAGVKSEDISGYSKNKIAYAYLDDELYAYMQSSIVCNDLRIALSQNLTRLPELYQRWASGLGKAERTVKSYLGAVQGVLSSMAKEHQFTDKELTKIGSFHEYQRAVTPLYQLEEFKHKDERGKSMYSSALKSFGEFLADLGQVDVSADVDEILQDNTLNKTEKSILVNARLGQGNFRRNLLQEWQSCAVTGYQMQAMLVASHIKPWRASNNFERLDPANGLLLVANLDKAFDKGFISFDRQGKILIASILERPEVLGIHSGLQLAIRPEHDKYLSYHRTEMYAGH